MGCLIVGGMTCLDVVHDQLVHLLLNVVRLVAHGDLRQGKERKCMWGLGVDSLTSSDYVKVITGSLIL
jgi:hypothetical protein